VALQWVVEVESCKVHLKAEVEEEYLPEVEGNLDGEVQEAQWVHSASNMEA
jgi:hypothetical protein